MHSYEERRKEVFITILLKYTQYRKQQEVYDLLQKKKKKKLAELTLILTARQRAGSLRCPPGKIQAAQRTAWAPLLAGAAVT